MQARLENSGAEKRQARAGWAASIIINIINQWGEHPSFLLKVAQCGSVFVLFMSLSPMYMSLFYNMLYSTFHINNNIYLLLIII